MSQMIDACSADRRRIEQALEAHLDAAERLIAELDRADSEADLEPSLGSLSTLDQRSWAGSDFPAPLDAEVNGDESDYSEGVADDAMYLPRSMNVEGAHQLLKAGYRIRILTTDASDERELSTRDA